LLATLGGFILHVKNFSNIVFVFERGLSGAQYVTLRKYFSHPNLVMYSFATSPIKLKLREQIGVGLLITNHLDHNAGPISETLSSS
jgi:hypothetical protein